jgi:hypothetical protein
MASLRSTRSVAKAALPYRMGRMETDQSLTLRNLGRGHRVLVAEPSLLAGQIIRRRAFY